MEKQTKTIEMYGRKQAQVIKPSKSSERELSSVKNLIKPKLMDKLENIIEEEQNIVSRTKMLHKK